LEGTLLDDAARAMQGIWDDHPGFEVEPGSITLGEIKRRAAAFDPLTLRVDSEVMAVSANCWESLGSRGLALHVYWGASAARKQRLSEVLVLDMTKVRKGGRRWRVTIDGKEVERYSRIEDAVEAVDFEVHKRGAAVAASARASASWRSEPVPADLQEQLAGLVPPQLASNHGAALRQIAFATHGPKGRVHPRSRPVENEPAGW